MVPTVIAIVADCDGTLAPDTTGQLLGHFGIDADKFYKENAGPLVDQGFDPPLAYLNEMLRLAQGNGPLSGLTREKIREIARQLEFFPGVPGIFERLRDEIHATYGDYGIRLDTYVITAGIADLVADSALGLALRDLWGCNFFYDGTGRIDGIKNVVSFTEKTRFLFAIEKGLVGSTYKNRPYEVNKPMRKEERLVPIKNMIYVGDGPSDVPCMSILQLFGGVVIGLLSRRNPQQAWALGYGRRANITVPEDFREGEIAFTHIRQAVIAIADRIKSDLERSRLGGIAPAY